MSEVSVIIPCFQAAETIQRCVDSVMRQTYLPLEIILIDDGSTDATLELLYDLQRLWHHTCKIVVTPTGQNMGVAAARNAGWALAKGRFIAFLDADDVWHPEKLALQTEWMRLHPEVDLTCHAIGTQLTAYRSTLVARHVSKNTLLFKNQVLTSSVLIKRDVCLRFNTMQTHSEDYQLWLKLAFSGYCIYYLEATLARRFKLAYGSEGLSKNLWAMQCAELTNYLELLRLKQVSFFLFFWACFFSTIKFIRRLLIHLCRILNNKLETL